MAAFALCSQLGLPRDAWNPILNPTEAQKLTRQSETYDYAFAAACLVAFHSRALWSDEQLARRLAECMRSQNYKDGLTGMLEQLGEIGQKYLGRETQSQL